MAFAIRVPTGEVVGIGKLKVFATKEFPHEIPTFSFLVAKADDGRFLASCKKGLCFFHCLSKISI